MKKIYTTENYKIDKIQPNYTHWNSKKPYGYIFYYTCKVLHTDIPNKVFTHYGAKWFKTKKAGINTLNILQYDKNYNLINK